MSALKDDSIFTIPPPVTPARVQAEIRRRLKKKGFPRGYTPNPPAYVRYDGPRCAEDDCEAEVRQAGWRCHVCSARAHEIAAAERKREAWARSESKRKAAAK